MLLKERSMFQLAIDKEIRYWQVVKGRHALRFVDERLSKINEIIVPKDILDFFDAERIQDGENRKLFTYYLDGKYYSNISYRKSDDATIITLDKDLYNILMGVYDLSKDVKGIGIYIAFLKMGPYLFNIKIGKANVKNN